MSSQHTSTIETDVVTVPDFSNTWRAAFTLRTLFFLASWETHRARHCRLHLACIGEPPHAVRVLAEDVGAHIHVFEPLVIGHGRCLSVSKLRGLEIVSPSRAGKRVCLLDTDMCFVNDPTPFLDSLSLETIAAAPGSRRAPSSYWQRVYAALELPEPSASRSRRDGIADSQHQWPYWNSGAVVCPWHAPLRETWTSHLLTIFTMFPPPRNNWEKTWLALTDRVRLKPVMLNCDQMGFATAVEALKVQGFDFQRLPDALNARPVHFQSGALRFEHSSVFHAMKFGHGVHTWSDAASHVAHYAAHIDALLDEGAKRRGEVCASSTKASEWFDDLWKRRIAPVVREFPVGD